MEDEDRRSRQESPPSASKISGTRCQSSRASGVRRAPGAEAGVTTEVEDGGWALRPADEQARLSAAIAGTLKRAT
jgi:hypothetical protein